MKKIYTAIFISVILSGCCYKTIVNDEFISTFSSENRRIAGKLYLDVFNGNLDTLTYDYYINYLQNNEVNSSVGITNKIRKADMHYFEPSDTNFVIILYYGRENTVLGDISNTFPLDTIYQTHGTPNLESLADKLHK